MQTQPERKLHLRRYLLLHFRPQRVNEKTLRFTLSWGLGGMAVTLVLLQMVTGILMKFIYVPTPIDAYASVRSLVFDVPFGRFVRNIHYWGANFLVLVLFLHLLRVFFTGAFHAPRRLNWIIGLGLFATVLAANLSGYLLPYDQLAYWAITVLTAMLDFLPVAGAFLQPIFRDGTELGPHTLSLFFSFHTAIIPLTLLLLMGFHFWRIRKVGGLVVPRSAEEKIEKRPLLLPTVPHLLVRELTLALVVSAVLMLGAVWFDAPFSAPANPGMSPNPVRAPWYFAGFQELLLHIHPAVAVSVVPFAAGCFLVSIPFVVGGQSTAGVWFASAKGRSLAVGSTAAALFATPVAIAVDSLIVKTAPWASNLNLLVRDGLLPMLFLSVFLAGVVVILRKRYTATAGEVVQTLFVLMATAFVLLTLVGVLFRGPYMKLVWPV